MTSHKPTILLTNDDGIYAAGIKHLWHALKDVAHVTVVAPLVEQSAVGMATTLRQPLRIEKVRWEGDPERIWSVNGTPADCVKLALNSILVKKPDLVLSGINRGSNAGRTALYSGTVAAAIESIMQEIPAIAFSCHDYHIEPDYQGAEKFARHIVQYILANPLPEGTLLNVNFPEKKLGPAKGFKMTHQGKEWWGEDLTERTHPSEGHTYFWLGSKLRDVANEDEGDGTWLRKGYITAVPICVGDLTNYNHLKTAQNSFENSFSNLFK